MFNDLIQNSSASLTSQLKALRSFGTSVCPQNFPAVCLQRNSWGNLDIATKHNSWLMAYLT